MVPIPPGGDMPRLCSSLLLSLLIASSASAVTMDWTFVGNPGNSCDPRIRHVVGANVVGVAHRAEAKRIAQYAEFLNAKA